MKRPSNGLSGIAALLLAGLLPAAAAIASPAEAPSAAADPGAALRHDPFRRPRFAADGRVVRESPAEREGAPPAAEPPPPWQPALRGVMLAGADSIANVEGTIVRIGESIDGWRLVRVADGLAVFAKAARQTTLTMTPTGNVRP